MRNQSRPSSILPLLLPWLGFVTLTMSMPGCDMRGKTAADTAAFENAAPLEIDAARSEAF